MDLTTPMYIDDELETIATTTASSSAAVTTTSSNLPIPAASFRKQTPEISQLSESRRRELIESEKRNAGKWQKHYEERLKNDMLYCIFACPNNCQEVYEYIMRFLWQKFEKEFPKELEFIDVIFETERGKKSKFRANRPIEASEKILMLLLVAQRFREISTMIVKESSSGAGGFFDRLSESSPQTSIVHWVFRQSFNVTNIHDIFEIAVQFAFMDYMQKGLPFALIPDRNPREQLQEYMTQRIPIDSDETVRTPNISEALTNLG